MLWPAVSSLLLTAVDSGAGDDEAMDSKGAPSGRTMKRPGPYLEAPKKAGGPLSHHQADIIVDINKARSRPSYFIPIMSTPLALPPSLDLPPHLSAHKYFFVCTLTVAAWDTLVLSPRTWKLFRTKEWPVLKILFHFMRLFMPIEFTIVGEYYRFYTFRISSSTRCCFLRYQLDFIREIRLLS